MTDEFDFDKALKALQSGKPITGKDGFLTPLIKKLTEAALEAELDSHLAQDVVPNRKNGTTSKTVKSTAGPFELDTPRDRAGNFEPQLIKKHQWSGNRGVVYEQARLGRAPLLRGNSRSGGVGACPGSA